MNRGSIKAEKGTTHNEQQRRQIYVKHIEQQTESAENKSTNKQQNKHTYD